MAEYALITARALDVTDLYSEAARSEGLEAVIVRDPEEAKRIVAERGSPRVVIADLEMTRDSSFRLLREVQSKLGPHDRPAVLASVSRELRTTAGDLTDALGIAEVFPRGADVRTVGYAIRRALTSEHASKTDPSPPPESDADQMRMARIFSMGLVDDGPPEKALEELVAQTAEAFSVPIALVSLTLEDKQWFKAHVGLRGSQLESRSMPRDGSFCTHVVESGQPLEVPDANLHPAFATHPWVRSGFVSSYAGAPLITPDGEVVGALCILDNRPAPIGTGRMDMLARLARRVAGELELKSKARSSALEVIRLNEKLSVERESHQTSKSAVSRFEAVLSHLEGGVMVTDRARRVVYANPAAAELLNIPLDRMMELNLSEFLRECGNLFGDPRGFLEKMSVPPEGPFAFCYELDFERPERRTVRWSTKPIETAEGVLQLTTLVDLDAQARSVSGRYSVVPPASTRGRAPKRKRTV